jgi:hypothetical protein
MRERLDTAHDGEPTAEIAITDKAVAQMWIDRPDYKKPFNLFYLNPTELSEGEISDRVGHNEERVRAMLRQARMLVGFHIVQLEKVASD